MSIDYRVFSELPVFHDVSEEVLRQMWELGSVKHYSKKHILIQANAEESSNFIQMSGKSIIYNLNHAGRRKILFVFGPGDFLNDEIFEEHRSSVTCEMLEPGDIFVISKKRMLSVLQNSFALTRALIEIQDRKIWRLGHQLKNSVGSLNIEKKLAAKLYKLSRDFGTETEHGLEIDMDLSITLLADMVGAPRETVSKACKNLGTQGYIIQNRRRVCIPDVTRLREFYLDI